MHRTRRRIALLVGLLLAVGMRAQQPPSAPLRIDEDGIRLHLLPKTRFEIPFVNSSGKTMEGNLLLEMLADSGEVAASFSSHFLAKPGTPTETIFWASEKLPTNSPSDLGWYRLRYTLEPAEKGSFTPLHGVIQLGRLMADAFEVRIAGASQAAFGTRYPVRIRVDNPGTGRPLAHVPVAVTLEIDGDDDHAVRRQVMTDRSGYAVAIFDLPDDRSLREGKITAMATEAPFREEEFIRFDFLKQPGLTITTDKPLYQPGQTVHMRLLGFGFDKHAWQDARIKLTIQDEERNEEYHSTVTTSSFGIATADWDVPQKLRLGDYLITAEIKSPNDSNDDIETSSRIRIRRYELPTFTVKPTPDRSYYLPGQDARVEVRADYLFGKPVQRARVKVVRQDNRSWNFKEQRWEAEESVPEQGELDSSGKFVAHLRLSRDFADFQESQYRRFEDLTFAAYVTDSSTGRTEQRRFKLRLSAQPIHLYFTTESQISGAEPLRMYVTSSYADGTHASVNGTIEAARPNGSGEFDDEPDAAHRVVIGKFHTSPLGVARVELPPLPENLLMVPGWYGNWGYFYQDYYRNEYENSFHASAFRYARLFLRASDAKGLAGKYNEEVTLQPGLDYMRVHADRALYHPGEAIAVTILSNTTAGDVIVNFSTEEGLVASHVAHLKRGRAELTVPYDSRFHGQVNIVAYAMTAVQDEDRALAGVGRVIYPSPEELSVGIHMPRTTFRPGENVRTDVHVNSPDGKAVQSALGVLVFDRAVAERVRTDNEFGRGYGFSIFDYFDPDYQSSIAGLSYRDLLNLDPDKPFTPDMDLAAELILRASFEYWMGEVQLSGGASDYAREAAEHFRVDGDAYIKRVKRALDDAYATRSEYPKSEAEFRAILKVAGTNADDVRDPWDVPYRPVFSVAGAYDKLKLVSNGVDKRPGTADDFTAQRFLWRYFRKVGLAMDAAVQQHLELTGVYVRDYETLRDVLKKRNIDLDAIRDPWGNPYRYTFSVSGASFQINVDSPGPDRRFDSKVLRSWDDVNEWTIYTHYFQKETAALERALAEDFAGTGRFPQNEEELKPVLQSAGLAPERLLDPWGRPYHFGFTTRSRYWDRVETRIYSENTNRPRKVTEITPVTQKLAYIQVISYGPEDSSANAFPVAEFNRAVTEQASKDFRAMPTPKEPPHAGGKGGISGTVTDQSGAVIAGVLVVATSAAGQQYTTQTDSNGVFTLANVPTNTYRLEFVHRGFRTSIVTRIPVQDAGTTKVDTTLLAGGATETVEVSAGAPAIQTTTASVSERQQLPGTPSNQAAKQLFTPRLRQYFPETLVWRPEIISDGKGNAHFNFTMADNITAWKMSVVASTRDGHVGVAEKELRSFQPFFVELDPPKILTEGDRITLPVVLRNYTAKKQVLQTELQPGSWFSILSAARQSVGVPANSDANAVFSFRADSSTQKGMQRVTARNAETGDAVERQVAVHPDGQQISLTVARVLSAKDDTLDLEIPNTAIRGSAQAELRIYPNLMAHVLDALDALRKLPGGCNEQLTSHGYSSLLVLKALNKTGQDKLTPGNPRAAALAEATESVQETVDLLMAGQNFDGGFAYWHGWQSDVALTAYVLRFLTAATEFAGVRVEPLDKARAYLFTRQSATGAWRAYDWIQKKDTDDPNLTAYVARALAETRAGTSGKQREQLDASLKCAMDYLEDQIGSWNDAYLVGNYAIAAVALGRNQRIDRAQWELARLAHNEGTGTYWNLEANTTPFYGWGGAGRVETTALAVEALVRMRTIAPALADSQQISRGLEFLLDHKSRYGVWYSSQATQNVIEAIIAALPPSQEQGGESSATLMVNGKEMSTIKIPPPDTLTGPITVELDRYMARGMNQVRVAESGNDSPMNAALFASYYLPHSEAPATKEENLAPGDKRALRLKVQFDRTDASVEEPVLCHIEAERIGFRGYGMMLAEVGLPPGADVDRASLEKAKNSGHVNAYEVQPDKVVFYLWPKAGGTSFEFQFRMRFRMEAMSGPSLLYDYYNPEARATVSPARFVVR